MEDLIKLVLVVAMFGSALIDLIARARKSRSTDVEREDDEVVFEWPSAPPAPVPVPMPPSAPRREARSEARRPEPWSYDDAVEAGPRSLMAPKSPRPAASPTRKPSVPAVAVAPVSGPREVLRRTLRSPASLRQALVMAEVLGPPPGLSRGRLGDPGGG